MATHVDTGLRRGAVHTVELVAQGVSNIAPSAVIAFVPASISIDAGNGSWLSFLLGTIAILIVGYCIIQFSKRRATAGSLYSYTAQGAGPYAAYVTGTAFVIGCWGIAAGSLSGGVQYTTVLLNQLGWHVGGLFSDLVILVVFAGLAMLLTIIGIRLSARTSIVIESISVVIIVSVLVTALVTNASHGIIDPKQLSLSGSSFHGVSVGMALAILGFVGFASSDALGREARNPFKAIPRAIMWPAAVIGVIYVFATYVQVLMLGGKLGSDADPMASIARLAGIADWFQPIITFGITASFFAVVIAPLNVLGRVLYVMGKEGVITRWLGHTGDRHLTPHRSILACGISIVVIDGILFVAGNQVGDVLVWFDTYGSFGFMLAFIVMSIAAVRFLRKIRVHNPWILPAAIVVVVVMLWVFYTNVYPAPAFPLSIFVYAFFASVLAALVWLLHLHRHHRDVLQAVGTLEIESLEDADDAPAREPADDAL